SDGRPTILANAWIGRYGRHAAMRRLVVLNSEKVAQHACSASRQAIDSRAHRDILVGLRWVWRGRIIVCVSQYRYRVSRCRSGIRPDRTDNGLRYRAHIWLSP